MLANRKVQIDVIDKQGKLPLHYASQHGHSILVDFFLARGKGDINLVDTHGKTYEETTIISPSLVLALFLQADLRLLAYWLPAGPSYTPCLPRVCRLFGAS
jgi:ankyrin repeat protein